MKHMSFLTTGIKRNEEAEPFYGAEVLHEINCAEILAEGRRKQLPTF